MYQMNAEEVKEIIRRNNGSVNARYTIKDKLDSIAHDNLHNSILIAAWDNVLNNVRHNVQDDVFWKIRTHMCI